ncbi:tRNA-cytidine(32) 2-sulfurtransferase [Nymphon striatum]|nr:tRNA-cytidine(32) 2-sulfurtransferase [Nymphon striatum]
MLRKFVGLSENIPEKKAKISQKEKDDVYETTKRKRGVVGSWKTEFPWLLVSEKSSSSRSTATDDVQSTPSEPAKLYCNPCRSVYGPLANPKRLAKDKYNKYANGPFVVGCSNLRHGALVCHQNSEGHKHAIMIQTAKASKPGDIPADRALAKLNDKNFERLGKLFRNAHAIVKNCRPMTDFTWMAKLDKAKDVDIGDTYLNDKSCKEIIVAIAESTRHPIEQLLESAKFVSIIENQGLAYKDAVFISTHKFLGGVGTPGILVAKKSLFHNPVPYESGGGTIFFVSRESHRYLQDVEAREEGGTPDIVGAVRAGLVFQMKEAISNDVILKKDESNISKAMKIWKKVDNLIILGNTDVPKLPIFSFLILHKQSGLFLHHNFVAAVLNDVFGIQCRGGCACAGPYALDLLGINEQLAEQIENHLVEDSRLDRIHLRRKGEYSHREVLRPGFVRLNLPFFMNDESLDFIINAVKLVCEHAWKLLPLYIVNPETGEWKHHSHQVMKDRKWLGSLSYNEGKFSYPVHFESESQSSLNHQECLLQAEQIFANAENISLKIKLYDQSVIFDASSDKLRSFILPSEAQAYLRNEVPEINPSPFFPKSYPFSENVHQFQGSANQRDLFIKSSLSIPGKVDGICNEDSVNTLMTEILSHLKNMKSDALNVANDKLVIDNNLKEMQNTSVGDKERIDKFSNKISVIEKALNEIRETILKENYELRAKLDNRTQKEFINSDHDGVKGVLNQDAVSLKAKKTKKEKKKLWHYPPKSILKPTLKVFLLCEYSYYVCGFCDKNMWPSSSPDISPMDFAIWSILKSDILAKSYSSAAALKEALLASWSTFDEEAIEDFDMIKNHDRLLVCLSGGKDSLSLLHMIKQYQFIAQKKGITFSLGAVTVDPQTESYNPSSLKEYLAKLNVPYFYEEQCIIEQAATLPEQCTSICSFCSRMKRGRIYACARREGYNVLALGQHLDDLTESFMMSVFHNGRLGTMKANYTVKEGDLRVIRPFVFVREEALRNFAIESRLPVIAENCPACFEAPKERHRMKQLLAAQEVIFPKLYSSLKSAILPIMSINRTGIDGRHLYSNNNDDSDD